MKSILNKPIGTCSELTVFHSQDQQKELMLQELSALGTSIRKVTKNKLCLKLLEGTKRIYGQQKPTAMNLYSLQP